MTKENLWQVMWPHNYILFLLFFQEQLAPLKVHRTQTARLDPLGGRDTGHDHNYSASKFESYF